MKTILLLPILFVISNLKGILGQDEMDRRLEQFLNDSLAGLPKWMKQQGYVPDPLWGGGNFTLNSANQQNVPIYQLTGEITNRYYHGVDKNIRALDIHSNLSYSHFSLDLAFGDGQNDFIEGQYSLHGSYIEFMPVNGDGKFIKSNQLLTPLHEQQSCRLDVTDQGYFQITFCRGVGHYPKFANFTLKDLNWSGDDDLIQPVVKSWYNGQFKFYDVPNTTWHWYKYMTELFAATPIDDIIGTKLAPTVKKSTKKSDKFPNYSRKPYFDKQTKKNVQQIYFSN